MRDEDERGQETTPGDNGGGHAGVPADEDSPMVVQLRTEARESRDRMLRIAADFENFKKRNERERQEFMRFASERMLRDLLPVIDNLSRALESVRKAADAAAITAGLELVIQDFLRILRKNGAEPVAAVGKSFDPTVHEALHQIETDEYPPGTVIDEVQRGYLLNGRVLRPALVVVAARPEVTAPELALPIEFKE